MLHAKLEAKSGKGLSSPLTQPLGDNAIVYVNGKFKIKSDHFNSLASPEECEDNGPLAILQSIHMTIQTAPDLFAASFSAVSAALVRQG